MIKIRHLPLKVVDIFKMSDILSDMKIVSVRSLQRETATILERVNRGEELKITKRNKVIARILPPENYLEKPLKSDFQKRFLEPPLHTKKGTSSSIEILHYMRGE